MAWTFAVVIAILGLASILLFLNQSFDKSKQGVKVFLTMLCLGSLVLLAQVIKLIIENKASAASLANLQRLATANLIVTVVIFSFFMMYFMITYTVSVFYAVRDSKKEKEELSWNA